MEIAEVEKQVFKKLLSNPKLLPANIVKVSPDDFTKPLLRTVVGALSKNGHTNHFTPNRNYFEILLRDEIRDHGKLEQACEVLAGISANPTDMRDFEVLVKELKAHRMCREMTNIIKDYIPRITPSDVEEAYEQMMKDMLKLPLSAASGVSVATVKEVHESLEERIMAYTSKDSKKFPTGIKAFDQRIGGFARGEFVIITAGTGQGKSNVMLWWAEQYVKSGANVVYVTIEMSYDETMGRYHAIATGFDVGDISNKRIPEGRIGEYYTKLIAHSKDPKQRSKLLAECARIVNSHDPQPYIEIAKKYPNRENRLFVIDTEAASPSRIEREISRLAMDNKIDYVFVDFINVMDPEYHNRDKVKELASIARDLKKVARKTKTTLFSAAQLDTTSLSGKQDEKIDPDRVKYARAIAENADWMVAFHRTEQDKKMKQIRLQLAKHRHSGDCTALLEFDFATLQAVDLGHADEGGDPFTEVPDMQPVEMDRKTAAIESKEFDDMSFV